MSESLFNIANNLCFGFVVKFASIQNKVIKLYAQ